MAATAITCPVGHIRRDWLGALCLWYVTWMDRRKADIWKAMVLEVDKPPPCPRLDGFAIRTLGSLESLPILTRLHNRAYKGAGDYQKVGWVQRRALICADNVDPSLIWLVYDAGKPIAYCMCRYHEGTGHITGLAVLPECRRRKIGTKLMQHAIAELAQRGATEIHLEVPRQDRFSQDLYEKLGFQTVG